MATFGDIAEITTACPLHKSDSQDTWKRVDEDPRLEGRIVAWVAQNAAGLRRVCSENAGRRRTSRITRRRTNLSGIPGSGVLEIIYPLSGLHLRPIIYDFHDSRMQWKALDYMTFGIIINHYR